MRLQALTLTWEAAVELQDAAHVKLLFLHGLAAESNGM